MSIASQRPRSSGARCLRRRSQFAYAIVLGVALYSATLVLASSAVAVTEYWSVDDVSQQDAVREAMPTDLSGKTPDKAGPHDTALTAWTLRIDAAAQDHVVSLGSDDWFSVEGVTGKKSSPDFCLLQIGTPGPLSWSYPDTGVQSSPRLVSTPGTPGDDLIEVLDEISLSAPGPSGVRRLVRVSTSSAKPVAYRISLVSQEPTESVLGRDTARDAAEQYLFSIAVGDPLELSWATGTRLTTAEMTTLREKLFKTSREFTSDADLIFHPEEVSDSMARLPSQRIVISEGEDASGRRWPFVVECVEKPGGRWFVKHASVDTPASNDHVDAVIQKDVDDQKQASRMEALGGIGTYAALAGLLWLLPLVMTLVCELPVAALFGVGRRGLAAVALINVVTNPALNFLLLGMYAAVPFALISEDAAGMSYSVPWWTYVTVLLLEIVVVWVEWRMLVWALHETVGGSRKLLVLAVSMNAVSALLGSALLFGWPLLLLRGS